MPIYANTGKRNTHSGSLKMIDELKSIASEFENKMLGLLKEMVEINSYTYNKEGVDRVGKVISTFMEGELGFSKEIYKNDALGDNLLFLHTSSAKKRIMLCGHMDTVFPPELNFNTFKADNRFIYGPGVIDMKGGLAVGMFALLCLKKLRLLEHIDIAFLFNSDEEIGSPSSRGLIKKTAENSSYAMVLECGGLNGEIVTGRKGKFTASIEAKGKSGHAAFIKNKSSAILELAHKTIRLEELNDFDNGITVNVGVFNGGMGPNSVPEEAAIKVDARFKTQKQQKLLKRSFEEITRLKHVDGVSSSCTFSAEREPMEQTEANRELFRLIEQQAEKLNIQVKEEFRFGVSDANTISSTGTPVVDGMGPIGDRDHSTEEYMVKESFKERALLLALTLTEL